ncbi:YceD family protein [Acidimicrobiaceae bacterium]|nr:YceD family protein [Acidimicrobiaceae bacterium]MDA8667434.1 YceD family protein [Candidatus Actinomarina sp.]MDC3375028.1 YceD family protein [Acidimicrobiia bacterium]
MSQLNTIFNLDKVLNTNSDLNIDEKGLLNIKYSGTASSNNSNALMTGFITRDGDYVLIELSIYFTVDSECSRCLKISTKDKNTVIKEKIYLKSENDYDIDFKGESIDVQPIISEKIIDSMSLINLCKIDCNGLCVVCGVEQNSTVCKHEEKNLKESPFSSLSELDL